MNKKVFSKKYKLGTTQHKKNASYEQIMHNSPPLI